MSVRLSRALVNQLAGGDAIVNESYGPGDEIISFGDGTGTSGRDEILAAAGTPFSGFHIGDYAEVMTESGTNDGSYKILDITNNGAGVGDTIEVAAGSFTTEAAVATGMACVATSRGHSLSDIFKYSVIRIYSGSMPASANATETGTLLMEVTVDDGAFAGSSDTNGLLFDSVSVGALSKSSSQTWQGSGAADGTAAWGRLYDNAYETGDDTDDYTAVRLDFEIASDGSKELTMDTTVSTGVTKTIDTFDITVPQS